MQESAPNGQCNVCYCVLQALSQLASSPESLDRGSVLAAEQAVKHILQDCARAMVRPSLLGSGSQQFQAFIQRALPEFESQMEYLETLIADCQESCLVRSTVLCY